MKARPRLRWYQFSLRGVLVAITLMAMVLAIGWSLIPWWRERVLVAELRQRVLTAKSSADAGAAYHALMQPEKRSRLRRLMDDPDPGIAVKACFELHKERDGSKPMSDARVADFVTFLRKRTGLDAPVWWTGGLPEQHPNPRPVPASLKHEDATGMSFETQCRDGVGFGYPLRCSRNGIPLWDSDVWALGVNNIGGGTSGFWTHDSQLVVDEERIVIWGAGTGGSYVETFDRKTGENQFRFCTEFWYAHLAIVND